MFGHGAIRRPKPLRMSRRLNPLHALFALPRGPLRVFTAVVERMTLTVRHPSQALARGRDVTLSFIGGDDAWHVLQPLEQLAKELLATRSGGTWVWRPLSYRHMGVSMS